MLRALIFGIFTLSFSSLAAETPPAFIYGLEEHPWQGETTLASTVDEASGMACLEYSEYSPQQTAVFYVEFPDPDLDQYDALEFSWKLGDSDANVVVSIEGYPENSMRQYYLRKRPNPRGHWQQVFLSLRQDDDGAGYKEVDAVKSGTLRLKFSVSLRDLEGSDNPHVLFRFTSPRLVRYPVRMEGDFTAVETFQNEEQTGQRYKLHLINQTDTTQKVHLASDNAALENFSLKLPSLPIKLASGEKQEIEIDIFVDSSKAKLLPPLYLEEATLFAWAEQYPDLKTTWFDSYFINRLIGTVPPDLSSSPWFVTDTQRKQALEKIANIPEAQKLFQKMEKESNEWLEKEIILPKHFHGYSGYYTCREHSSPLRYQKQGSHWCIKGEHVIEGDEIVDRAGDYLQHSAWTDAALELARVGWLTQDKKFSKKAADILLAYAEIYPELPLFKEASTGYHSRIAHAVLGECWWFDPIPYAFDLVRGAGVLSEEEDTRITKRLILPAISTIHNHRNAANQHAEINHAVGVGAFVAKHWPLAAEALDGEVGIRFQWKEDFDLDGMSVERELPYHFVAVRPFAQMAQAYETAGLKIFDQTFKRLFNAPIAYSSDQNVQGFASVYELALAVWDDPDFARQVKFHREKNWNWDSLLSPVAQIEDTNLRIRNSTLPAGGYTTLRQELNDGSLTTAMVNYGSPAWRGGKALLDPLITWKDLPLNLRIFRIGYGYDGKSFSYTPAAGNSLLVDRKGGSMLRAEQVAILDSPAPAARWTTPPNRPLFAGVEWSRTIVLCENTTIVLDQLTSKQAHQFDLITYLPYAFNETPQTKEYPDLLQEGDGYEYFRHPTIATDKIQKLSYPLDPKKKNVTGEVVFLGTPETVFLAEAQAGWHPRWIPSVIRRFNGNAGWSVTAFSGKENADAKEVQVRPLPVTRENGEKLPPEEALAIEVISADVRYRILTSRFSEKLMVENEPFQGPLDVQK